MSGKKEVRTKERNKSGIHLTTGIITLLFTLLGGVLYYFSHSTNYYTFGQMNSKLIVGLIGGAFLVELAFLIFVKLSRRALWVQLLPFAVTALLAASAMFIVGDRVEGIGNCIITDYDSGHGGEEAIYISLIAAACLIVAMIYNIIGSFHREGSAPASLGKKLGFGIIAGVMCIASIVATMMLTGFFTPVKKGGEGAATLSQGGTYKISFNSANENIDTPDTPDYQFLSADMSGLLKADSRFYVDVTLTLDGKGAYTLISDSYVIEAGKRAEIGDDTGLGMIYQTKAEGTYTENEDGTITTAVPAHALFEVKTDTYSAQMKPLMHIDLGGSDADGAYDSADYPEVLDYVPETIWTLSGSEIVTYESTEEEEEETTEAAEETEEETTEEASAAPEVTIVSDDGGTRMVFSNDGVYHFLFESYNIDDEGTWFYKDGVLTLTDVNGKEYTAEGDPLKIAYAYSQSDQLTGDFTIPAETFDFGAAEPGKEEWPVDESLEETETTAPAAEPIVISSKDEATTMTFNADGTYVFEFAAYGVKDEGTWTYEDGELTVVNANDLEMVPEDGLLHYVSGVSDQLTGDFEIDADVFE